MIGRIAQRMLFASLLLFVSTCFGFAEPIDKDTPMIRIQIVVGDNVLPAVLDDTPSGRDFAKMLPLDLDISDYHGIEKVADLPRKIDTTDAPASYAPKKGDITVYAPWGNLAIFYKPFSKSAGLIRLGQFEGPIDALVKSGSFPMRIEKRD